MKQNRLAEIDAPCFGDILAHARAIYLLRKFDITYGQSRTPVPTVAI